MAYHVRRCDLVGSHLFADLCHIYHACFSYRHTYAFGNSGYFSWYLCGHYCHINLCRSCRKIGIFKAGSIANLAPFIASIIAVPLLGEMLNTTLVMGLIGMAIGALQPWRWFIGR